MIFDPTHSSTAQRTWVRSLLPDGVDRGAARWCLFTDGRLLVAGGAAPRLPHTAELNGLADAPAEWLILGRLDGAPVLAAELTSGVATDAGPSLDLRAVLATLPPLEAQIAGYAAHLLHWNRSTRFCPVCGSPTEPLATERAKQCPRCEHIEYPRVSPAIIVLIVRPGQVLLSRQPSWPAGRYSLIAGFVEPGETLEQCVRREVAEEASVTLGKIRYLGSQAWPFPQQLMVGFVAEWAGGEVVVDRTELDDARWFDLDQLPDLPSPISISRMILDWYMNSGAAVDAPFPGPLRSAQAREDTPSN